MSSRRRRGMLIKNTDVVSVDIPMVSRTISLEPGEETLISAEEVLDSTLRMKLQVRAVAIVRPATDEEDALMTSEADPENSVQ